MLDGGGGGPSLTGIWTLDRLNKFYQRLLYHLSYVGFILHFLPKCDEKCIALFFGSIFVLKKYKHFFDSQKNYKVHNNKQ